MCQYSKRTNTQEEANVSLKNRILFPRDQEILAGFPKIGRFSTKIQFDNYLFKLQRLSVVLFVPSSIHPFCLGCVKMGEICTCGHLQTLGVCEASKTQITYIKRQLGVLFSTQCQSKPAFLGTSICSNHKVSVINAALYKADLRKQHYSNQIKKINPGLA